MRYDDIADKIVLEKGVEKSTMMKSPCLRFQGDFIAMMFDREDSLIIKVSPNRVDELIADTGFKPNTSIESGIFQFVSWYKGYYK